MQYHTQHPALMHASLAVAHTYDRSLRNPQPPRPTLAEHYHRSQATTLFNQHLKYPLRPASLDPTWGTAAALAVLTFTSPDAETPEQAWPMATSRASDFDWLRISKGKMSLWHAVNPLREGSVFRIMAPTFAEMFAPLPGRGRVGVPGAMADLCGIDEESTGKTNAYFEASHSVAGVLALRHTEIGTGRVWLFVRSVRGRFEELLRGRDPVALVLLYLWYCKAGRGIWWVGMRARVECPAICMYLQLYHRGRHDVHAFLPGGAFAGVLM